MSCAPVFARWTGVLRQAGPITPLFMSPVLRTITGTIQAYERDVLRQVTWRP